MNSFEIFTGIFGGLGLFLYGMKQMSDGLENVSGEKLKGILEKITSNKVMGVLVGTAVTAIIQSSSATTVMVVSFVNAGLMDLSQAIGVILGSNIGTTITAQMVSFRLEVVAPIFIGVGEICALTAKKKKIKDISVILIGFGILFMGMGLMSSSMKPVAELEVFKKAVIVLGRYSVLSVLVGVIITAIVQSSSATTAILVALASAGTIDMKIAFPIVLGCNIGTCVTAIIASLGANRTAKKAALLHLSFNIFGTIIFLPLASYIIKFVAFLNPDNLGRQVANSHTFPYFHNNCTYFTPTFTFIIPWFIKFINKILPENYEKEPYGAIYLDKKLLETPMVASTQAVKETIRMANISKNNFKLAMEAFFLGDENRINKVYENEKVINRLEREITEYLIELSQHNLPEENAQLVSILYHTINDVERIGDHAENIVELAMSKINNKIEMSDEALSEMNEIFQITLKSLDISIKSFENNKNNNDINEEIEDKIDTLEKKFRNNNIARLNAKQCYANAGVMFFDLLSNLERIGDHANNISNIKEEYTHKIYI